MAGDWLRLWPAQVLHMISSTSLGLGNLGCLICCSLGIHRIAGEGVRRTVLERDGLCRHNGSAKQAKSQGSENDGQHPAL